MTFVDFARAHGVLIGAEPAFGRWVRLPTEDHPRTRNGAVKFMGDHGFVQNHATMQEVAVWKADDAKPIDMKAQAARVKQVQVDIQAVQRRAAEKAEWVLGQCELLPHPYLEAKGFKDHQANVWAADDKTKLLVIPMRVGDQIVGCQLIDEAGGKKFLFGQRTSEAVFVMGARGLNVLCEGYATGLSVRAALAALKVTSRLFVCFSAGNLGKIAKTLPKGLIVADHDASGTGERVAKETGWPYFMPPEVGQDFNDFHLASSLFRASQALRVAIANP